MKAKKAVRWECSAGELSEDKPEEVTGYQCAECDELHLEEPEKKDGFICGECEEFYEDRDDAVDCCKF